MNLDELIAKAMNKSQFNSLEAFITFGREYVSFLADGLEEDIIAGNKENYHFFQYKERNRSYITRPINYNLFIKSPNFDEKVSLFQAALSHIREFKSDRSRPIAMEQRERQSINEIVYTCQQAIGATLDAIQDGESNAARKINGDLFEELIRQIFSSVGISAVPKTVSIPIAADNNELGNVKYQHDLVIKSGEASEVIGSVKTSSKDRIAKVFFDKFSYNQLKGVAIPHIAIFLNDVQRKKENGKYKISLTFTPGHFKLNTSILGPLDGVYYCDLPPNMQNDTFLKGHIKTLDTLLVEDIWKHYEDT